MLAYLDGFWQNSCCLHNSANVISGESPLGWRSPKLLFLDFLFPLSSFSGGFYPPLLLSLAALSTSPWLRVSVAFLPCGSGHRRFSPSSALHPQYPPLRQFLSRSARTITSSSRPSHRLLSRMLFGNIRYAVPPARPQCGCNFTSSIVPDGIRFLCPFRPMLSGIKKRRHLCHR